MVELFGGIYQDALSPENVECFAEALSTADVKKQKQLLRIVKRLLSSNLQQSDFGRKHAGSYRSSTRTCKFNGVF